MKTQRRCFITQFTIYCLSKLIKFKFIIIDEGPFTILQTVGRFRSKPCAKSSIVLNIKVHGRNRSFEKFTIVYPHARTLNQFGFCVKSHE